jgi:hypothetical protein
VISAALEAAPRLHHSSEVRQSLIFVAFLSALLVVIALLIVALSDVEVARAFPLTFYVGGAFLTIGGFLSAVEKMPYWYSPDGRAQAYNLSYVYAALGVVFVALGILFDTLL